MDTINTTTMSNEQIATALQGASVVTDGVGELWELSRFLAALNAETGRPAGEYQVFSSEEWQAEIAAASQD